MSNMNDKVKSSQVKSEVLDFIWNAVGEQLKSQGAVDGLEKGKRGTIATPQQMVGSRRWLDDIVIDMIENWPKNPHIEKEDRPITLRECRRGPRSIKTG